MNKLQLKFGVVALACAFSIACGGSGGGKGGAAPAAKPHTVDSSYGITAHVRIAGHPEQSGWVKVPPVDFGSWDKGATAATSVGSGAPGQSTQALAAPGIHALATVGGGTGGAGSTIDTNQQDTSLNYAPGWSLLYWATTACYAPEAPVTPITYQKSLKTVAPGVFVSATPWSRRSSVGRDYYVFGEFNPGAADPKYNYGNPDDMSCDALLAMQETLLCAADHLAQLGDSPGTVTWSGAPGDSVKTSPPAPVITVTIPPQRSNDIFIARDMALNALAHLLRLDTKAKYFGPTKTTVNTCVRQYAFTAAAGTTVDNNVLQIGSTYFDPEQLSGSSTPDQVKAAALIRLSRKANVLTSAARLTKSLLERSVQGDISGAQQLLSSASDAHVGARLAWGVDTKQVPYNTLRHALRTLFGRLEIGNDADPDAHDLVAGAFAAPGTQIDWVPHDITRDDPQCGFYYAADDDVLFEQTGRGNSALNEMLNIPGLSARWDDVPPKTPGEALALSLLNSAGIVVPAASVESRGAAYVRGVVQSALEDAATSRANLPAVSGKPARFATTADFLASPGGQAFESSLASISDAEMSFGLQRVYDAFRLLTATEPAQSLRASTTRRQLDSAAAATGMVTVTSAPINGLGGVVLQNGVPRDELAVDPMASLGRLQHASACDLHGGLYVTPGADSNHNIEDALTPSNTDVSAFQNPFFLADGFRRVLANISYEIGHQNESIPGSSPVGDFAQLSAAEVREWAGPGSIATTMGKFSDGTWVQQVYLVNISPEDLGIKPAPGLTDPDAIRADELTQLKSRLVLVSASPDDSSIDANCAAGLRKCAPSTPPRTANSCVDYLTSTVAVSSGLDNPTIQLGFDELAFNANPGSYLTLEPSADGQPGQVLAWLKGGSSKIVDGAANASGEDNGDRPIFAESYSRLQRSLVQKVFGLDQTAQATRSCDNIAPLSLPAEYCIAGMKRDAFVPLANELNSSGAALDNSWQNYLDLADAAATKADTLGAAMIADGLSNDVQKESAMEKVADLCGGFTSVDKVASTDGSVTIPDDDPQLSSCVNPKTYDIVFFRTDPFDAEGTDATKNTATYQAIWDRYCVTPTGSTATPKPVFCAGKSRGERISHAGLGFSSSRVQPPGADVNQACAPLVGGLDAKKNQVAGALTMRTAAAGADPVLNSQQFNTAVAMSSSSAGGIGAALQQLRLNETPDGEWLLTLADRILTGSTVSIDAARTAGNTTPVGDIWPYCASQTGVTCSGTGTWVSKVFANAGGTASSAALRSLVEKTIFYMGALSGGIPQGHVQMPVPVVDRSDPNQVKGSLPSSALYAPGVFKDKGDGSGAYAIQPDGYQGDDKWGEPQELAALGDAFVAPAGYAATRAGGLAWQSAAYSGPAPLKYVIASNDTIAFDPGLTSQQTEEQSGRALLDKWLQQVGQSYATKDSAFLQTVEQAAFYTKGKLCSGGNFHNGRSVCSGAPGAPTFFYKWPAWLGTADNCQGYAGPGDAYGLTTTNVLENGRFNGDSHRDRCWLGAITAAGTRISYNPKAPYSAADSGGYYFVPNNDGNVYGDQMIATETHPSFNWDHTPWHWGEGERHTLWQDRLKASVCSPSQRLEMFMDTDLKDRATAVETLVRALSLSCLSANSSVTIQLRNSPPPIRTVDDIRYLSAWVNQLGYSVDSVAAYLYLVDVPADVLELAKAGGIPDQAAVGAAARGQSLFDLQQNMNLIENGFATVGANLQAISAAIEKTRVQLSLTDDEGRARGLQIASAQLNNERDEALATISLTAGILKLASSSTLGLTSIATGGAAQAANNIVDAASQIASATTNLVFDSKISDNLDAQASNSSKTTSDQESLNVLDLSDSIAALNVNIDTNMNGIKNNTIAALKDIGLLLQNQSAAKIALATASGADFVNVNGTLAPLHVNTVYRRQFDIANLRYTQALEGAKRAAYLARLSIEQRLGVRLDELHQNIGPLEPPATWVDDLCTVQGVDYSKLNTATAASSDGSVDQTAEKALEKGFANQFIGDYVSKLREFVQFYNVAFPFEESDDVAIVSLREDLPATLTSCTGPSRNLLLYSDRLNISSPDVATTTQSLDPASDVLAARAGWGTSGCDQAACLTVQSGAGILVDAPLPVAGPGAASLLLSSARDKDAAIYEGTAPPGAVFQSVQLAAGTSYVLSWWDIARNGNGSAYTDLVAPPSYQAAIFDSSWKLVGGSTFQPDKQWGDRRVLQIFAKSDGLYNVVFTSGPPGTVNEGLGIANVQLEQAQSDQQGASPYQSNAGSTTHVTGKCSTDSPSQLRDRFQRKCGPLGCYYELKDVLAIDTQLLNQGSSSLLGKLAAGNYNYRNGTVAVNFVGTGVIDCSRSTNASCNGSAYVDYDLEHVAYDVPMDDHSGGVHCFDFGSGTISSGKGLASERFITLPMSSGDRDIINQSPFLKPDFSGRPLSGSYRLRVKDSPSLVWSNVQDVQIIYGYHYWSRVQQSPGN